MVATRLPLLNFTAPARSLPLYEAVACRPALMQRHRALTHYLRWLETPAQDPYWAEVSPAAKLDAIVARRLPMLLIGGWYDSHFRGTLAAWHDLAARQTAPMRFVVGPWIHFPWDRSSAGRDFGAAAGRSMDALQIRWFDHWLKGIDSGVMDEPAVELFDLGARCWRGFPRWPEQTQTLHLGGSGAASIDTCDGTLAAASRRRRVVSIWCTIRGDRRPASGVAAAARRGRSTARCSMPAAMF